MMMRGKDAAAAAVLAGTCEGAFAASPALDKADVAGCSLRRFSFFL
ncbi:MAG: hypothetical protein V8R49_06130 [Duodenibacillus massiliensis]